MSEKTLWKVNSKGVYIESSDAWKVDKSIYEAPRSQLASFLGQKMKIYALISRKLVLTQFWPKVVSWRFEITTDALTLASEHLLWLVGDGERVGDGRYGGKELLAAVKQ